MFTNGSGLELKRNALPQPTLTRAPADHILMRFYSHALPGALIASFAVVVVVVDLFQMLRSAHGLHGAVTSARRLCPACCGMIDARPGPSWFQTECRRCVFVCVLIQ